MMVNDRDIIVELAFINKLRVPTVYNRRHFYTFPGILETLRSKVRVVLVSFLFKNYTVTKLFSVLSYFRINVDSYRPSE